MNNKDFNDDYFINMLIDISKDDTQNSCPNVCQNEITYKDNIAPADTSEESSEAAFVSAQPIRPLPPRSVRPIPSPPRPPVRPVPPPSPPRPPVRPVTPRQPLPRPSRPIIPIPIPIPVRPERPINQRTVLLAEEIYKQIKSLEQTYMTLMRLGGQNQAIIERMKNELTVLAETALNIYKSLSGSTSDPFSDNIYDALPRNYCLALRVTLGRVSNLYDDVLALQRLVSIADIDRQLIIMASVLQRQLSTFNTLLIDCIL